MPTTIPSSLTCTVTKSAIMSNIPDIQNKMSIRVSSDFWPKPRSLPKKSARRMNQASNQQPTKRLRTSKPKVKTGCITCKIRRVKCGEEKPECVRCTSTGRKCDGYSAVGSSQGQKVSSGETTPLPDALVFAPLNPTWDIAGTDEECRSFEFFRSRTSIQLSGFFDPGFWNRLVLQAAHYEPAVRHAVLALSSLHERFEIGDKSILNRIWDRGEGGFALQHYNQAIQQLINPNHGSQQAVDVCLISCMLFASFETLRGHHGSAMSHISAGVRILSEIHSSNKGGPSHGSLTISSRPFVELAHLEVLFNRLDSQVVQMFGTRPMTLGRICKDNAIGFHAEIPMCFTTLEEGRNSFDYHWNGCIQLFNDVGIGDPHDVSKVENHKADQEQYLKIFQQWNASFQAFLLKNGNTLDSKSCQGARVLQIMHIFAYTNVRACHYFGVGQETIWDQYLPRYKRAIALAEEIINTMKNEAKTCRFPIPNFSLEMNFVAPLYSVAHKCRDPAVRRKVVELLYASPRQEGIWDSFLAARVAEKFISIEEDGLGLVTCCEDVPDVARLSNVDVQFDTSGRFGTIKYSRMLTPHETKRRDYVEMIEW